MTCQSQLFADAIDAFVRQQTVTSTLEAEDGDEPAGRRYQALNALRHIQTRVARDGVTPALASECLDLLCVAQIDSPQRATGGIYTNVDARTATLVARLEAMAALLACGT